MRNLSVYIHIPFCAAKCAYCDFLSFAGKEDAQSAYVEALCAEIRASREELACYAAQTVFFGGGTPTVLPARALARILDVLRRNCRVEPEAEITAEANPESVDAAALRELRAAGFNRLSLGVQAFDDGLLRRVSRAHTAEAARDAYAAACESGFRNVNIDLMYGIPGQSPADFEKSLRLACGLYPEHISCYSLTVEPGSPLGKEGFVPDENADREMYALARGVLIENGYEHYEISNFALPGYRCRHNTAYWSGQEYIGFGLGAHSLLNGTRFNNITGLNAYINARGAAPRQNPQRLRPPDIQAEYMILGLRMTDGINCKDFAAKFDKNIFVEYAGQIKELAGQGLIEADGERVRLTERGLDLANRVMARFI